MCVGVNNSKYNVFNFFFRFYNGNLMLLVYLPLKQTLIKKDEEHRRDRERERDTRTHTKANTKQETYFVEH